MWEERLRCTHFTGGKCANLNSVRFFRKRQQHTPFFWSSSIWSLLGSLRSQVFGRTLPFPYAGYDSKNQDASGRAQPISLIGLSVCPSSLAGGRTKASDHSSLNLRKGQTVPRCPHPSQYPHHLLPNPQPFVQFFKDKTWLSSDSV